MWAVFTIQKADIKADAEPDAATREAMRRQLSEAYTKLQSMQDKGNGVIRHLEEVKDFSHFMDQLAMNLQVSPAKKTAGTCMYIPAGQIYLYRNIVAGRDPGHGDPQ